MSKLTSREAVQQLRDTGILPANTRRMIIDIEVGQAVKVYYDTFAAPTLMQVITPEFLMNAETVRHSEPEASKGDE